MSVQDRLDSLVEGASQLGAASLRMDAALRVKIVDGLHLTAKEKQLLVYAYQNNKAASVYSPKISAAIDWSVSPHKAESR